MDWKRLVDQINSTQGHFLLRIGFMPETRQSFMFNERALIIRAVLHENLLSLHLAWEAFYHPFQNQWMLQSPPNNDGSPVQVLDGDVTGKSPKMREDSLVLIDLDLFVGAMIRRTVDPLTNKTLREKAATDADGLTIIETGMWIVPPGYDTQPMDVSKMLVLR